MTVSPDPERRQRFAVLVTDDHGRAWTGTLRRRGPAFLEVELTTHAPGDLPAGSTVTVTGSGVGPSSTARVVRSGRRLVVQVAPGRERRVHPRLPFHRPVRWRSATSPEWRRGRTEDLSTGGLRLLVDRPAPVGSEIVVEFELSGSDRVELEGVVLAATPVGPWHRVRLRFPHPAPPALVDVLRPTSEA